MSEVGLRRCERAGAVEAIHLGDARVFDGVADRGAGAVRLDHADGAGVHAPSGQRRAIGRDLCGPRWCRDVHRVAILVCGGAAYHSQDPVPIPQRIR